MVEFRDGTKPAQIAGTAGTSPETAHHDDSDAGSASSSRNTLLCLKCHKKQIVYECDPCGCPSFCTSCAMKLASGGRCKTCHQAYGGLRRLRV
ncbi:unnamed protein product [Pseudo-nitzschia multistriata]|uniref:Uncharacterized protein n=1 Tax=Pseudo-nitzschia multistriata TaxID=183589 RepID=A0A448YVJ3_9STRA|nr:unnamed protein product [Pseudo-nitzschia multistriata]